MTDIKRLETGPRMSPGGHRQRLRLLAGQVGEPGTSVTDQTTAILNQIDALLAQAGTDKTRIVSAQIWMADMTKFAEMNAVLGCLGAPGPHARPRHRRIRAGDPRLRGRDHRHRGPVIA